jgi:hypothetical protein
MRGLVARSRWLAVASAILLSGCDSIFGSDASITLTPSSTSANVGQGASTAITLTLNRSNFKKDITITVDKPTGITASVSPTVVPNGLPTAILTISAAATATPGAYPITVHATGDGVDEQMVTIEATITVTGSFSASFLEPSVTVAQGGAGTATLLLPRFQGNASSVSVVVNGAPSGVTVGVTSSPTTQSSATLAIAAGAGVAAGTYTVSAVASSPGFADQTATFPLTVIAPPATTAISVPFCANDVPNWFAYQNEGYGWQRVTATGANFNFNATDRVSIAFVWASSTSTSLQVLSTTRTELAAAPAGDCDGQKSITGTIAGLSTGQTAFVNLGSSAVQLSAAGPSNFTLTSVQDGALDLVGVRGAFAGTSGFFTPDALVLRRSLDLANGAAVDAIDFASAEAFAPASMALTIGGLQASETTTKQSTFWSAGSTYAPLQVDNATAAGSFVTVPAAKLIAGDLHELYIEGDQQSNVAFTARASASYFAVPGDRSESLGPVISTPTVSLISSAPYARFRVRVAGQAEYPTMMQAGFYQAPATGVDRFVTHSITSAYLAGLPSTWELVTPDVSAASGFDPSWMLLAGGEPTGFYAQGYSGRTELLLGARPVDADNIKLSYRVTTIFASQLRADALLAESGRWVRPKFRQYFRR